MPPIIFAMSMSLDGFIEDPRGSLDWAGPDETLHRHFNELERSTGTMLYGRRLYEIMSAFWPTADEDPAAPDFVKEYARIWRAKPRVVFSHTLQSVGHNSRLVRDDLAGEVARLKAQPGGDLTVGGAGLAASLMRLGLIDEYQVYVHPVLLGGGKPMFEALPHSIPLTLLETRTFPGGVLMMKYRASS
jgi:dihydrofolate reductase